MFGRVKKLSAILLFALFFASTFLLVNNEPAHAADSGVAFGYGVNSNYAQFWQAQSGYNGGQSGSGPVTYTLPLPSGAAIDYASVNESISCDAYIATIISQNNNNTYYQRTLETVGGSLSVSDGTSDNFSNLDTSFPNTIPPWVSYTPPYQNGTDIWGPEGTFSEGVVNQNIPLSSTSITVNGSVWGTPSNYNWQLDDSLSGTAYYIMPPSLSYTTLTSNTIVLTWTNPGSSNYNVYENGALLANAGNVNSYTVNGLFPGTQYTINVTAQSPEGHVWTGLSNTVGVTTPALTLQANGSQTYWNQQINFGNGSTPGVDYHLLVTELNSWGNPSGTTNNYDIGDVSTYSVPMQPGKYYEVQEQEASPVATAWSSPVYVWNAPDMANNGASIAQVTSTTATIKWEQVAPNQQMDVWWMSVGGSSWSSSGEQTGFSYEITGLSPNTQYYLRLSPYSLPNGGTGWWAAQQSFYTDSAPGSPTVTIDGGATGTNVAKVPLSFTATSVDAPIVAYGVSNTGSSYTWFPYTTGQSNGLLGSYYANPSDTAYGQPLCDSYYVGSETDPQVNVPDGTTAPAITNDPGDTNWGAAWLGSIWIGSPGTYNFAVPSNDGASLTVNGQVLVQDWNPQGEPAAPYTGESGTITFNSPGWYPVLIHYFQGGGAGGIQFMWEPPGSGSYTLVPSTDMIARQNGPSSPSGNTVNVSTTWGLSGNGSVTVYCEVMTADGTISSPGTASINLLTAAQNPVLKLALDNGASSTTDPTVNYVLTATGAGLPTEGQMQYQINGGSWSNWVTLAQTGTITLPSTAQVDTVTFQVQDGNGLESQASAQITLQPATPPGQTGSSSSGTQGIYDGKTVYYTNSQSVIVSIPTPSSGTPVNMQYSNDGINWSPVQPWTTTLSLTLPTGDGLKPVYVDAYNASGVQLAQSTTNFVLDTETPTITELQTVSGADATSGSSIEVMLQASEDLSATMDYSVNGGTSKPIPASGEISVPISNPSGLNAITVTVTDPAGNSASKILDIMGLTA